jgi:predicted type IV restriction endonuclease
VARIRPLVCEVVDELKKEEWPAERVIVALKTIAREASLVTTTSLPATQEITSGDRLLGESVRRCIEHYYRDT